MNSKNTVRQNRRHPQVPAILTDNYQAITATYHTPHTASYLPVPERVVDGHGGFAAIEAADACTVRGQVDAVSGLHVRPLDSVPLSAAQSNLGDTIEIEPGIVALRLPGNGGKSRCIEGHGAVRQFGCEGAGVVGDILDRLFDRLDGFRGNADGRDVLLQSAHVDDDLTSLDARADDLVQRCRCWLCYDGCRSACADIDRYAGAVTRCGNSSRAACTAAGTAGSAGVLGV